MKYKESDYFNFFFILFLWVPIHGRVVGSCRDRLHNAPVRSVLLNYGFSSIDTTNLGLSLKKKYKIRNKFRMPTHDC